MLRKIATIFFFLISSPLLAQTTNALAQDKEWLALLHYNPGTTVHDIHKSYVDDARFFLAPDGKTNPYSELEANILALAPPLSPARCQFPARFQYLSKALNWPADEGLKHCDQYLEWQKNIPSARAVLVFPASYLNSPSSMFGHTLLRLDSHSKPDNVWDSWAINFGADITNNDNSITYIWRGLGGGYPGKFTIVPYIVKIQEYSHMENRDMWEYELALDNDAINRLISHLWELRDINFDYYFLDENCSFRLLEIIDVAKPGTNTVSGFRLAEVPVSTIRTVAKKGLITQKHYRPSKEVELQASKAQLSSTERQLAAQLMKAPTKTLNTPEFMSASSERKYLMAQTAWRALRLAQRKKTRTDDVAERSMALLNIMQANTSSQTHIASPTPPEDGHGLQMLALGAGQSGSMSFSELQYRLTYHDLLDNSAGFLKGAQINGMDIRLRATEDAPKLESLDAIHIRSISPRDRFVKPLSWHVQTGLERVNTVSSRPLASFLQGGAGFTWEIGQVRPYILGTARVEHSSYHKPYFELGAGGDIGLLWYHPRVNIRLSSNGIYFENTEYRYQSRLEAGIPLSRNNALRLHWQQSYWHTGHQRDWGIAWRHYFN